MKERFCVVAGNYSEFLAYRQNRIVEFMANPSLPDYNYVYVDHADKLRGMSKIKGCYYGSYMNRKDIMEIQHLIKIIKNIEYGSI